VLDQVFHHRLAQEVRQSWIAALRSQ